MTDKELLNDLLSQALEKFADRQENIADDPGITGIIDLPPLPGHLSYDDWIRHIRTVSKNLNSQHCTDEAASEEELESYAQELDQIEAVLDGFTVRGEPLPIAKRVKDLSEKYEVFEQTSLRRCNVCNWSTFVTGVGCYKCMYDADS